jgi:hypothetical protein
MQERIELLEVSSDQYWLEPGCTARLDSLLERASQMIRVRGDDHILRTAFARY